MSLDDYTLIGPLTYRGKEGCTDVICTRRTDDDSRCYGWHCSYCDAPCSYQDHKCPASETILGEASRVADERRAASEGEG